MENSIVALTIFLSTIAISAYTMYKNHSLLYKMMFSPYEAKHNGRWHTLITSGFVHADLTHLIFNMLTFYFFAFKLEAVVGPFSFLIIYFGSMVLADIGSIIKHKDNPNYRSLGASGAISGVVFSTILYFPTSKMMIMPIPVPIPAVVFGGLYLAWCYFAAKQANDNINHSAHFIGALAGIALTIVLEPNIIPYFLDAIL